MSRHARTTLILDIEDATLEHGPCNARQVWWQRNATVPLDGIEAETARQLGGVSPERVDQFHARAGCGGGDTQLRSKLRKAVQRARCRSSNWELPKWRDWIVDFFLPVSC